MASHGFHFYMRCNACFCPKSVGPLSDVYLMNSIIVNHSYCCFKYMLTGGLSFSLFTIV